MLVRVHSMICNHEQEVLINCISPDDAKPYLYQALARGTCKMCGCKLLKEQMALLAAPGVEDFRDYPNAIDVSDR